MIQYFEENRIGHDWVVGDIHGMFSLLESTLDDIDFNRKHDRLFCTGDLIDRGYESIRVLEFLKKPWFFSVRGNHDMMPIRALRALLKNDEIPLMEWKAMGGEWFDEHAIAEVAEVAHALMDMPMAFEIQSANGLIGITHGEPKIGLAWPQIKFFLENGCHLTLFDLVWGRHRLEAILGDCEQIKELSKSHIDRWSVEGVHHLITGHSIIPHWLRLGNIHYLDTGACYERGCLTLLDISYPGFLHHRSASCPVMTAGPRNWPQGISALNDGEDIDFSDPANPAFLEGQKNDVSHTTHV